MLDIQKKYQPASIIITHDMQCARISGGRIVVLNDGEFIAEGTYSGLENSDNDFVKQLF